MTMTMVVIVVVIVMIVMFQPEIQGFYRKLPTSPGSPYPSFSLDANEALKVIQSVNQSIKLTQ